MHGGNAIPTAFRRRKKSKLAFRARIVEDAQEVTFGLTDVG